MTVPCESFDLLAGPSPSGKVSFKRKKNTALRCSPRALHSGHWPVISDDSGAIPRFLLMGGVTVLDETQTGHVAQKAYRKVKTMRRLPPSVPHWFRKFAELSVASGIPKYRVFEVL